MTIYWWNWRLLSAGRRPSHITPDQTHILRTHTSAHIPAILKLAQRNDWHDVVILPGLAYRRSQLIKNVGQIHNVRNVANHWKVIVNRRLLRTICWPLSRRDQRLAALMVGSCELLTHTSLIQQVALAEVNAVMGDQDIRNLELVAWLADQVLINTGSSQSLVFRLGWGDGAWTASRYDSQKICRMYAPICAQAIQESTWHRKMANLDKYQGKFQNQ